MRSIIKTFILLSLLSALIFNAKSIRLKISESYDNVVTALIGYNATDITYLGY